MRLTENFTFAASPERVAAMLVDPDFAKHVGVEIKATGFQAEEVDSGLAATYVIPTPDRARGFVGPDLIVTDTVTWQSPTTGRMEFAVQSVPASMGGMITLRQEDSGCVATYDAEFRVRIPLVGAKIEKMASQYMTRIIHAVEKVGNDWLTKE